MKEKQVDAEEDDDEINEERMSLSAGSCDKFNNKDKLYMRQIVYAAAPREKRCNDWMNVRKKKTWCK